jgi:hypothetical protein
MEKSFSVVDCWMETGRASWDGRVIKNIGGDAAN